MTKHMTYCTCELCQGVRRQEYRPEQEWGGLKHDKGKLDWYALPLEILEPLAELLLAGEQKYGTFNCLEQFAESDRRFWSANMRHAAKCQHDPLAKDEETGCYHEAARAFCSLMRLYHARKEQQC